MPVQLLNTFLSSHLLILTLERSSFVQPKTASTLSARRRTPANNLISPSAYKAALAQPP